MVLLPYRFTLFSNERACNLFGWCVLLPYRFTLFSNGHWLQEILKKVLLPYRFTLFSNDLMRANGVDEFYYLIDLHYSQTICVTA